METSKFNLDQYQEYLNQKNNEYQQMLDAQLRLFRDNLREDKKISFEQESKDFLKQMQGIKDSYFNTYAETMKKIDAAPDGEIKNRRKRMTEQRLDEFLDICNQQIKNFIQGFEN